MKVVINTCYGGFDLSDDAKKRLASEGVKDPESDSGDDKDFRSHPALVRLVEEIGDAACASRVSSLKVVEVPDNIEWEIDEYDGKEWIAEKHRKWG